MRNLGYKYCLANAVNKIAKKLLEKFSSYSITIDLEYMYILSD